MGNHVECKGTMEPKIIKSMSYSNDTNIKLMVINHAKKPACDGTE
jgi:hypothetical protein